MSNVVIKWTWLEYRAWPEVRPNPSAFELLQLPNRLGNARLGRHCRLATHDGLEAFRIAGTADLNFREGFRDLVKILRGEFDVGASEVFFQAVKFGGSGNGN